MLRLTAIFIAVCVVLISASLSAVVYLIFGLSGWESATIGVAALAALALVNTVSSRLRDRGDVGSQITDLSRGMADLARQTAEVSRRLAAVEIEVGASERRAKAVTQPLTGEISELGNLVRHLAETVAAQEAAIAALKGAPSGDAAAAASGGGEDESRPATAGLAFKAASLAPKAEPKPQTGTGYFKGKSPEEIAAFIRAALDAGRLDLHLQPILTLPQRKVRYYEALARLRSEDGDVVPAADFIAHAASAGLVPKIDNMMLFRCVQVLRRLLIKDREMGLFCNISAATLADPEIFPQFFQFMEANRAIAPSLMLEFTQESMRGLGPIEQEALSALGERGFRFSIDQVSDLRMEPRELSDRSVRFVKVQASVLLNRAQAPADIHSADLSDLLGRFGISLIADRIETEAVVVDLLDYDVRFGQGHLFSPPRPVRAESLQGPGERGDFPMREVVAAGGGPAKAAETPAQTRAAI
jgi:cyclic-di-GMP phosphodiesterase TipF (flagellum assembly factor)